MPGLYVTATPIGNLGDVTERALALLSAADLILCEDTRVTGKLLAHFGIRARTLSYHDHNAASLRPKIMERLAAQETIALVSDAGMPLISDPGYKLVQAALAQNHFVTVLPGASSILAALCLSGLPTDRFFFAGFLPTKSVARQREIEGLSTISGTVIVLERASRLAATLSELAAILGPRPAAVARELTKLFEETRRAPLDQLAAHYLSAGPPKGEIVIVVGPPQEQNAAGIDDIDRCLRDALGRLPLRGAVEEVASLTGASRRLVYERALAQKDIRESR